MKIRLIVYGDAGQEVGSTVIMLPPGLVNAPMQRDAIMRQVKFQLHHLLNAVLTPVPPIA